MARAHGARAQMALAFESVYGTAPATGYRTVPFASTTLGSEQPLIASELLGQGRDPLAPIKDAVTADGDVVVPIDVENLGLWLKAAFGAPVTSAEMTLPRGEPLRVIAPLKWPNRCSASEVGVPAAVAAATLSPCATSRAVAVSSPDRAICHESWSQTQPVYIA